MRKSLALLVVTLVCLIASTSSAYANNFEGKRLLPSNYIAPRMDCKPDGQNCVLLAYDNTTKKVQVFITHTRFALDTYPLTVNRTLMTDANIGTLISKNPASAIPYDVAYLPPYTGYNIYIWSGMKPFQFAITFNRQLYGVNASGGFGYMNASEFGWANTALLIDHNTDSNNPAFVLINMTSGKTIYLYYNNGNVNLQTPPKLNTFKNWIASDYVGGMLLATNNAINRNNQSYILFPFNSTTGSFGYSNTTDSEIPIAYDGVFEDVEEIGKVFARNSTHVFTYPTLGGSATPFFNMAGNNILAQSSWTTVANPNDRAVVFSNSTGLYLWNTFSLAFVGKPNEYNLSLNTLIYGDSWYTLVNPSKPKIHCTDDMSACGMLFYDSGIFTKGVHFYYSTNPNSPASWQSIYTFPLDYDYLLTNYPDWQLPYDITYSPVTGKWRMFIGQLVTGTQAGTTVSRSYLYTWSSGNPVLAYTLYSVQTPIKFIDDDTYYAFIYRKIPLAGYTYIYTFYLNLTVCQWGGSCTDIGSPLISHLENWGSPPSTYQKEWYTDGVSSGVIASTDGTHKYCLMLGEAYWSVTGLFPVTYQTVHYLNQYCNLSLFDDSPYTQPPQYIYPTERITFFERNASVSPTYGKGMYYAGTANWVDWIYPTATPYYIYDAVANEETFADSDIAPISGTKYYAIEIKKGTYPFYTKNGIYFYQRPYYRTIVNVEYYDVPLITYRPADNVTVTLKCNDGSGYETTGVGNYFVLYTPCTDYNVTYQTTKYRPYSATKRVQFDVGCGDFNVWIRLMNEYQFNIRVVDDVNAQPISGANVNFGGMLKQTGINGYANYTIYPIINESIAQRLEVIEEPMTCIYHMDASGTSVRTYSTMTTKTGYKTDSRIISPAEIVDNRIVYYTERQINLKEKGTILTVRLIDSSGNEIINPILSSVTTVTGSHSTYVINTVTGDILLQNSANGMPVQFYLGDNRTTFNVTVNFTYVDYKSSQVVTVQTDVPKLIYVRINQTKTQMVCNTNLDCPTNFCDRNYWYKLEGCINGKCQFKQPPDYCAVGCDAEYGCYSRKFIQTCDTRYDCNSSCLTNWRSAMGLCSSDGHCIQIDRVCELECPSPYAGRGCNATSGLCCEDEICYEEGRERHRFLLSYQYSSVNDLIPEIKTLSPIDYDYTCGVQNRGERFCLTGVTIPSSVVGTIRTSKTTVSSTPDNWQFGFDENGNYRFYDMAIECGVACKATWEFCKYGCDKETTYCRHQPLGEANITEKYEIDIYKPLPIVEGAVNASQLKSSGLGFLLLFATPIFIVLLIAILISILVAIKTKDPLITAIVFLALLTVFSLVGLFPIWLVIILIIIAAFIFSKTIMGVFGRG